MKIQDEKIKVEDKHGFIYEVVVKHQPQHGFSAAYYNDTIIGTVEYGRLHQPQSDDDSEWEEYEERFSEWTDGAISDLQHKCKGYFNK